MSKRNFKGSRNNLQLVQFAKSKKNTIRLPSKLISQLSPLCSPVPNTTVQNQSHAENAVTNLATGEGNTLFPQKFSNPANSNDYVLVESRFKDFEIIFFEGSRPVVTYDIPANIFNDIEQNELSYDFLFGYVTALDVIQKFSLFIDDDIPPCFKEGV